MAIKIVLDGPEITLTESEYWRYHAEYSRAFQHFAGVPPRFEEYVRRRIQEAKTNEDFAAPTLLKG